MNQTSNHLDSTNQTTVANQTQGENDEITGKANQHLYQNVNIQIEPGSKLDHNGGLQLTDQNQDQQPANQEQLVVQLVANRNEQLVDQNEELQGADQAEVIAQDQQEQQQPADQNQAPQQAANGNADQQPDAEKAKVPYGVVTIHSDQSNTPIDNNYAEVRNEADENVQDITYDRVNDDTEVNENGYSTVVRDKTTQQQPQRDRMYESVDEAFERETQSR